MTNRTAAAALTTDRQVAYILSLRAEYADLTIATTAARGEDTAALISARPDLVNREDVAAMYRNAASKHIDFLKDAIAKLRREAPAPAPAPAPAATAVTEGMYRLDGVVYKVQRAVHGSGKLYAKVLLTHDADGEKLKKGQFVFAPGAIRNLTAADLMTVEMAKAFGDLYGMCCRCGATLTDEESIERGIGPVCAGRF